MLNNDTYKAKQTCRNQQVVEIKLAETPRTTGASSNMDFALVSSTRTSYVVARGRRRQRTRFNYCDLLHNLATDYLHDHADLNPSPSGH